MKNIFKRSATITFLFLVAFVGCKVDMVSPVVNPLVPTIITPDTRPVGGNYQFFFTDPALNVGIYRRYSEAKMDVIAAGPKSAKGYLTDITSVFYSNPNTQDWITVFFKDGYPTIIETSKEYTIEYKNYNKTAKTVDMTLSQNGKLIKEGLKQTLSENFFKSVENYNTTSKPKRLSATMSSCQDAQDITDALGFISSAAGCAIGAAGILAVGGVAIISGPGLSTLSSCFSAVDYLVGKTTGTSITERAVGKDLAPAVKLAIDFMGGRLAGHSGFVGAGMMNKMNDFLGRVGTSGDLAGALPCGASPAHSTGDPHITTIDGLRYDFQGYGEFIAVKSVTDNFEVQIRQEDVNKSGKVTMNTAVGIQTGSDIVCVTVKPDRLFINNQVQDLANFTTKDLKDGASISKLKDGSLDVLNVFAKNGDLVKVRFHGSYLLDYSLYIQENRKGKLIGIMGNYDGDKLNDVTIRDGENIMKDSGLPFGKLYPTFADSWRITQANSLFYYDAGKNTDTYTQKDFPRTEQTITAEQKVKAEGICRAAGVTTEPFLSNCILDVAITDDPALASSSLWGQTINTLPASLSVPIIQEAVDVKSIRSIDNAAFVLKADGTLWASGWNDHGFFGVGGENFTQPDTKNKFIKIWDGIKGIAIGSQGTHNLFLKNDNSVWAAGYNQQGQIGNGATDGKDVKTAIKIMDNGKILATGTYSSYVIKTDNTLWAWGQDGGRLGSGTKEDKFSPVKIMENVKAVSVGEWHTLILKTDNTLWVTGSNAYGEWGVGSNTYETLTPIKIMDDIRTMTASGNSSYIIKNDNTLWVSGNNYNGQLGIGTSGSGADIKTFQKLMDNVAMVDGNNIATFILKIDNSLWATGSNRDGQFGDGTAIEQTITKPKQVASAVKLVITSGRGGYLENRTFILKTDNTIWAAGNNTIGILGDGTDIQRTTFVPINVK